MRPPNIIFCKEHSCGIPTRGQQPKYDKWLKSYAWSKVVKCGKTHKNRENRENRVKTLNVITFLKFIELTSYLDKHKV